jgi:uncharacterized protein YbjT (DUF2867 family)
MSVRLSPLFYVGAHFEHLLVLAINESTIVYSSMSSLAFIGGTGRLGQEIAKGLITVEGFDSIKAFVRPESTGKESAKALKELGYEIVTVDYSDAAALEEAFKDIKVIVSTMAGGQLWKVETAVVEAAKKAGVSLFVPSQYGVDGDRFGSDFPFLQTKAKVLEKAKEVGLPVLKVLTGYFSDIIYDALADPFEGTARLVGDPADAAKISFTRRSDVGYVLAKALSDPEYSDGGVLGIAGSTMTWKEGLDLLAKVMRKEFEITTLTVEEAKAEEAQLTADSELDLRKSYAAFVVRLLTVPGTGNDGVDMSAFAKNYGHKMEPLEVTFQEVYIHPDASESDED